jgi:hypothetical protein
MTERVAAISAAGLAPLPLADHDSVLEERSSTRPTNPPVLLRSTQRVCGGSFASAAARHGNRPIAHFLAGGLLTIALGSPALRIARSLRGRFGSALSVRATTVAIQFVPLGDARHLVLTTCGVHPDLSARVLV